MRISTPGRAATTISTQRQSDPKRLSQLFRGELDWIVMKCLEKDRNRRYETATGLAREIECNLADEPVQACPPSAVYRFRKFARRHKQALMTAVLLGLVLVGSLAAFALREYFSAADLHQALGLAHTESDLKDKANEALRHEKRKAQIDLSTFLMDKGLDFCEQGDPSLGMLWLARSLENAPDDADDLQGVIRTNLAAWRHQTSHLQGAFPSVSGSQVAFSPNGKTILTVADPRAGGGKEARLWEAATGNPIGMPFPFQGPDTQHAGDQYAAFSPDGKRILTLSNETTAQLWDVATHQPVGPALEHPDPVHVVLFSRDGRTALTYRTKKPNQIRKEVNGVTQITTLPGPEKTTIHLWEAATGKPIGKPIELPQTVRLLGLSPDGGTILTGAGRVAQLRKAATGEPLGLPLSHPEHIRAAAFSPDGRSVLTTSDSAWDPEGKEKETKPGVQQIRVRHTRPGELTGMAQLWEVPTGKPIGTPLLHEFTPDAALFSPDGQLVVTYGGQAQVWYVGGPVGPGQPAGAGYRIRWSGGRLLSHPEGISAVAFSPDGRTLLTSGRETTRLWDVATGMLIGTPLQGGGGAVAFRPDGRAFLTGGRLWEAASGRPFPIWSVDTITDTYTDAGLAGSGGSISVYHSDESLLEQRIFSLLGFAWPGSDVKLHCLAFGADGKTVLAAHQKYSGPGKPFLLLQLREAGTGKAIGGLLEVPDQSEAALSPDGKTVVTLTAKRVLEKNALVLSKDKTLQLWEADTWKPLGPPRQYQGDFYFMNLSHDGRLVLLSGGDTNQLWKAATWQPVAPPWPRHQAYPLALSPNGEIVLTIGDGEARLREAATGCPLGPPLLHQGSVSSAAFSPDGQTVATGSIDKTARLWDVATGKPFPNPLHHRDKVTALAFSPDGRILLTGSRDGNARFWDVATAKPLGPPLPHKSTHQAVLDRGIQFVAFNPDGRTALTGLGNGHLRCWESPPPPLEGSVQRLILWVQTLTPMELDAGGVMGWQKDAAWEECRQRLLEQGGPPTPLEDVPAWHRREAEACMRNWYWFAAAWHFDRLIEVGTPLWQFHLGRGQARAKLGRHNEAIADLSQAIEMGATGHEVWHDRGKAYSELCQWNNAIADCTKAIQVKADNAEAHYDLALALGNAGRADEAAPEFQKAILINPHLPRAHCNLGLALKQQKKWAEAIAAFETAVSNDTSDSTAQQMLAEILTTCPEPKHRNPTRAVAAAKKAVELDQQSAGAWQLLGWAQYRAGDWRASIEALEKSCKLQGGTGDCGQWIVLALAHGRLAGEEDLPEQERAQHQAEAQRRYGEAIKQIDPSRDQGDLMLAIRDFRAEGAKLLGREER
jgi:WD40 repeat protein/tetratricopeptide (TPR) repeat protein